LLYLYCYYYNNVVITILLSIIATVTWLAPPLLTLHAPCCPATASTIPACRCLIVLACRLFVSVHPRPLPHRLDLLPHHIDLLPHRISPPASSYRPVAASPYRSAAASLAQPATSLYRPAAAFIIPARHHVDAPSSALADDAIS
jgi:hypothetical protein